MNQKHLGYKDRVNLGSYYTPSNYVNLVWKMLSPSLVPETTIIDSACGYGNFLKKARQRSVIGCDLDKTAVDLAKRNIKQAQFFHTNSLHDVCRLKFNIPEKSKLAVVGNPPYNDKTSIIRHRIKDVSFFIDKDIVSRDLGISFLLSYNKLKADWVCVLHPLSYLIKRTNFRILRNFTENYRLIKGVLISSSEFPESSKLTPFPIVVALYKRDTGGMSYDFIRSFQFKTMNKVNFCLDDFDYIARYVDKYPKKKNNAVLDKDSLFFWTMRDINALKRNRTFVKSWTSNTITIDKEKLNYYIYVDVFKRNIHRLPFYLGNCDVIIDNKLFTQSLNYFIKDAINHHPFLEKYTQTESIKETQAQNKIETYFNRLLGMHLVR